MAALPCPAKRATVGLGGDQGPGKATGVGNRENSMTTYTFSATRLNWTSGTLQTVTPDAVQLVTSDGFRLDYAISSVSGVEGNEVAFIAPDTAAGTGYSLVAQSGDHDVSGTTDFKFGNISWGSGKHTQLLTIGFHDGTALTEFLIVIGGDPLPVMDTKAELQDFFASVTAVSADFTGWMAPDTPIDPAQFASLIGLTQNDRLVAPLDYEIWGGGLVKTGVGNDYVSAGALNDRLSLGSGNDTGFGGDGNDTLLGGTGLDRLYGNLGDDIIVGDGGADIIYGGSGSDRASGMDGSDRVYGSLGDDFVYGNNSADTVSGSAGNDKIYGGGGDDRLFGSTGADSLIGGTGADDFRFGLGYDGDRIADFTDDVDRITFLSDLGVSTRAEALALARNYGSHVLFDFGGGDTLLVLNITKADLADDIFVL